MVPDDIINQVHRHLLNETDFLRLKDDMNEFQLFQFVENAISDLCRVQNIRLDNEQRRILARNLVSAVMALGPLRPLMEDKSITEIMINGFDQIYVQRSGKIELTDVKFESNQQLTHTIQKVLGSSGTSKRVDESSPYVDFSMSDGSRVNVILPPCSNIGPVMTIRKFKDDIGTVDDLLTLGMLDKKIAAILSTAMAAKLNIVFCGSTGSGKTTSLNVFSRHIPEEERIITIEDTPELNLLQEHVVTLLTKPANIEGKGEITMRELFVNSLRMRPDRIIVGEVRGEEILDLIQSITSGHSGSLAIVHADSSEDCFNRMVTMMLMTGIRLATSEIKKIVAKAVDLIVHIELFVDGKRRITTVTESTYDDANEKVILRDIIRFNQEKMDEHGHIQGDWVMDKTRPDFLTKYHKRNVALPEGLFE